MAVTRRKAVMGLAAMAGRGELPPLRLPMAGQFVGVHAGRLIVAGGTLWSKPKWEGGEKRWTPLIQTLGEGEREWRESGEQPETLSYGGSVSTPDGVLCIGGQSEKAASASVWLLSWDGQRVRSKKVSELPEPRMNASAAAIEGVLYLAGGQVSPEAQSACLTLLGYRQRWKEVEPWPGPARILAPMAACGGALYLASGADLYRASSGETKRRYLNDAWRFRPKQGWSPLPAPVVAASAICGRGGRPLLLSGDDGSMVEQAAALGARHPGFRPEMLEWDGAAWRTAGRMPGALVTTWAVRWGGGVVVPGGEDKPGSRSAQVLWIKGV
jgi:N-acetylneuraminic acid mutarotase